MGKGHRALASQLDPRSQTVLEALRKKIYEQPGGQWQVDTYSMMTKGLELKGFTSKDLKILVAGLHSRHEIILSDNRQGVIIVRLPSLVSEELRAALLREVAMGPKGHLVMPGLTKLRNSLNISGLTNTALEKALEQLREEGVIDFTVRSSGEVEVWRKRS